MTQNLVVTNYAAPAAQADPDKLLAILADYGQPDPSLVSKLKKSWKDKSGRWHEMELDYVGHAEITKLLIEIDPLWTWEPIGWDNGRPKINVVNGVAEMWGRLTVHGKTVIGVGTASAEKTDVAKELVGDFLRNAGMRLGLALSLWSKAEWDEQQAAPKHEPKSPIDEVTDDPFEWAHHSMLEATSIAALDAVAKLAKTRLNDEQRAELRPIYLEKKAELEGTHQ